MAAEPGYEPGMNESEHYFRKFRLKNGKTKPPAVKQEAMAAEPGYEQGMNESACYFRK